ncbi:MAG: hypothetical protein B6245_19470 [Desulfobacteraceae bacterium 4572_88]|nr:MAG: hypothetical protein B6245_19470 [Desulfobacteraceae bacterium 4572_88]
MKTIELIIDDPNWHLPAIARAFAETDDKKNFKHLLIPCAYHLDAAYRMCGLLARLYPEQAASIAEIIRGQT